MKKLLCLLTALVILISLAGCDIITPKLLELLNTDACLNVHFIDVGQGDSILMESDGEFVLIDAGEKEYGPAVLEYLKKCGADRLKYMIATHPHSDHIGGMRKVLDGIETDNFIAAETDQETYAWLKVLRAVDKKNINYIDAKVGDTYRFGEATFRILAPLSGNYEGYNNYSIVTMVECGDIRFLLTGDAETDSEKEMVNAGEDLRADVLKCGHHGSSTSTSAAFLQTVKPSYAIISCGKNNDYGHPHRETLKKLRLMQCTCLRTDTVGTIIASTDGTHLSFSTERGRKEIPTMDANERQEVEIGYVGNKNSHVFHYATCTGAMSMSEKNRVEFSTREEAIKEGYTPCASCEP